MDCLSPHSLPWLYNNSQLVTAGKCLPREKERAFQAEVRAKASVCKGSDQTWERVSCVKGTEIRVSLVAQRLKCLPAMWKTWVWSLGQEYPLEKEMATHSSTLAWRIPWREEPGRLQSMGSQRVLALPKKDSAH